MDEHRRTRDLLVPYVLDALDPQEERGVRHHLSACDACRAEEQALRETHENLVALAETAESPPPELKSRILAQLPRRRTSRLPLAAAAAAILALSLTLAVLYIFSPGILNQPTLASATLEPTTLAPGAAGGEIHLYDKKENVRVRLEVWGMPEPGPDEYYELWLVKDGGRMSGGTFAVGHNGRVEADLNVPKIAGSYQQVGVTSEKDDGNPMPSDEKMLGGTLDGP